MSKEYPCVYHKEGGYCAKFEEPGYTSWCVYGPCSHETPSNADLIRRMTDEELAEKLFQFNNLECSIPFCKNLKECDTLLDTDDGIPKDKCRQCLLEWLKQPADTQN